MSVAFLTRDFSGQFPYLTPAGCCYYRCALPMAVLDQQVSLGLPEWDPMRGFGVKESVGTGIFGYKNVMLKLIMDRSTPKMIQLAQNLGQRIFVDLDDFYQGLTPANKAYHMTHPEKNKLTNRDNYARVIELADVLTVSTPFLLDYYSKQRNNVVMVRNGVNRHMFKQRVQSPKPVIGWTGSINYRNNDLEQLRDWLPDFLEEHDLTFHHAGYSPDAPSFADLTGINPARLTTSPVVTLAKYPDGFNFDIGIVPLNDILFNHAKSNIKGLEYVAAGIPFVASDLPEYRILHESGVGTLARTADEWVTGMTHLLNYKTRRQTAEREYRVMVHQWTIEARTEEWRAVFAPTGN